MKKVISALLDDSPEIPDTKKFYFMRVRLLDEIQVDGLANNSKALWGLGHLLNARAVSSLLD